MSSLLSTADDMRGVSTSITTILGLTCLTSQTDWGAYEPKLHYRRI